MAGLTAVPTKPPALHEQRLFQWKCRHAANVILLFMLSEFNEDSCLIQIIGLPCIYASIGTYLQPSLWPCPDDSNSDRPVWNDQSLHLSNRMSCPRPSALCPCIRVEQECRFNGDGRWCVWGLWIFRSFFLISSVTLAALCGCDCCAGSWQPAYHISRHEILA